jgi:uncharacterized membrane protein
MSNTVEKSIDVQVPIRAVYNQWTQFEEFPRFMEGVQEVRQLADERLYWSADVAGEHKEWYARITRQVPDQVIAWESEGGTTNTGIVTFHSLEGDKTEVQLHMEWQPEDFKEKVGDMLGVVTRRVDGDLHRFKDFIEERGRESGGWRGTISSAGPSGGRVTEPTEGPAKGSGHMAGEYSGTGQGGTGYQPRTNDPSTQSLDGLGD